VLPDTVDAGRDVARLPKFVEEIQQLEYSIPNRRATERRSLAIVFQFGVE
jgi:hypothetical protein